MKTEDEIYNRVYELRAQHADVISEKDKIRAIMNGGADGIKALLGKQMRDMDYNQIPAPNMLHSAMERFAQKLGRAPDLKIDIFNDKNIIRQQNYFISNKNLYLNNSNPFNINWFSINIEFNKIIDFNIKHQYLKKYKKGFINDFTKITNELYSVKPYILYNNYIYKGIDDNCGSLFYRKY